MDHLSGPVENGHEGSVVSALPSALDGLRVVTKDDQLNNEFSLRFVRYEQGEPIAEMQVVAFDRDAAGLAELQRWRPVIQSIARFINSGGSIWELAAFFTDETDNLDIFGSDIVPNNWQLLFTSQEVDVPLFGYQIENSDQGVLVIEDELVQLLPTEELVEQFLYVDEIASEDGIHVDFDELDFELTEPAEDDNDEMPLPNTEQD
jgi:hypothetical protein